jgi:hypothetical protein
MRVRSDIAVTLRVLNASRFSGNMHNAARSISEFKAEVNAATTTTGKLAATSKLGMAAVYGLGAAVNTLVFGFGLLAATTIRYGIEFNATMESNSLAFSKFVGAGKPALAFSKDLFKIASQTPFSFEDITTAGRRLLAFGFNAKETTALLKTMGDTISYTGGSTDEILRLGKALGDIRAKGKLMQQEMNQLANVGIPIRDVLAKGGLKLTEQQLYNIGRANVPAQKAIDAIRKGLNMKYGGGAIEYMKTFNGQWQRLQDNLKAGAGAATQNSGLFGWMKGALGRTNDTLEKKAAPFFQSDKFKKVSSAIGKGLGTAFTFVAARALELFNAVKPIAPLFTNVLWPILQGLVGGLIPGLVVAWKLLIVTITVVATVLGFLGKILKPFGFIFKWIGWIIGFVFGGEILKVLGLLGKLGGVFRIFGWLGKMLGGLWWFMSKALGLLLKPLMFFAKFIGAKFPAIAAIATKLISPFLKLQMVLINFFARFLARIAPKFSVGVQRVLQQIAAGKFDFARALLNPKTMAKGEIMMLKAGIRFGEFLTKGLFQALGKISIGAGLIGLFSGGHLKSMLGNAGPLGGVMKALHALHIPGFAQGGVLTGIGTVGEHGPEIARHTPRGTVIVPLRGGAARKKPGGPDDGFNGPMAQTFKRTRPIIDAPVILKEREVGRIFGEIIEDRASRA